MVFANIFNFIKKCQSSSFGSSPLSFSYWVIWNLIWEPKISRVSFNDFSTWWSNDTKKETNAAHNLSIWESRYISSNFRSTLSMSMKEKLSLQSWRLRKKAAWDAHRSVERKFKKIASSMKNVGGIITIFDSEIFIIFCLKSGDLIFQNVREWWLTILGNIRK